MKRQFPGLHAERFALTMSSKAFSWFEWTEPTIAGIRKSRSYRYDLLFSNRKRLRNDYFQAGSTAPNEPYGN